MLYCYWFYIDSNILFSLILFKRFFTNGCWYGFIWGSSGIFIIRHWYISSVFLTSILVKSLVRPVYIVVLYPLLSTLMLIILYSYPTPMMCIIAGFVLGFTAAGGVLQLALTTMAEFFPSGKGKVLGIFFTSSSVATAVIPFFIGWISTNLGLRYVMLSDAIIAGLGTILAVVVLIRYRKIFNISKRADKDNYSFNKIL